MFVLKLKNNSLLNSKLQCKAGKIFLIHFQKGLLGFVPVLVRFLGVVLELSIEYHVSEVTERH